MIRNHCAADIGIGVPVSRILQLIKHKSVISAFLSFTVLFTQIAAVSAEEEETPAADEEIAETVSEESAPEDVSVEAVPEEADAETDGVSQEESVQQFEEERETEIGENGFSYISSPDKESWWVLRYSGTEADVYVPSSFNGLPVTMVDDEAFSGNTSIRNVILPETVTEIGWRSFKDCTNLETISFTNSMLYISDKAFENCSNLKTVYYKGTYNEYTEAKQVYDQSLTLPVLCENTIYMDSLFSLSASVIENHNALLYLDMYSDVETESLTWSVKTDDEWNTADGDGFSGQHTKILNNVDSNSAMNKEYSCEAAFWNGYTVSHEITIDSNVTVIPEEQFMGLANNNFPIIKKTVI